MVCKRQEEILKKRKFSVSLGSGDLFSCQVMSGSCDPMDYSIPSFPILHNSRALLKLMYTESDPSESMWGEQETVGPYFTTPE